MSNKTNDYIQNLNSIKLIKKTKGKGSKFNSHKQLHKLKTHFDQTNSNKISERLVVPYGNLVKIKSNNAINLNENEKLLKLPSISNYEIKHKTDSCRK